MGILRLPSRTREGMMIDGNEKRFRHNHYSNSNYLVDKLPISGDKNQIAKELCIIDSVTGSDIANAVLRATTLAVQNARNEICLDDLRLAINKCINVKNAVDDTEFRVSSRKVSGEYVKNIFDNGGMLNGNI